MGVYILFLYGNFEDHDDIEFFCLEILGNSEMVKSVKYVIENLKNIIVIFETESTEEKIIDEFPLLLINDNISYYFLFKTEDLMISYLPDKIRDLIFKPLLGSTHINIKIKDQEKVMDLDDLLDKIKKYGVESLTNEEKKFLDNFDN